MKKLLIPVAVTASLLASAVAAANTPSAAGVTKALQAAKMPLGKYVAYTPANDPNRLMGRPGQYVGKVNFEDKRIPLDNADGAFDISAGGSVEVFSSKLDAKVRYTYISAIAKSPLFSEYDYLSGDVLLRLSHLLTPKQAAQYAAALKRIV